MSGYRFQLDLFIPQAVYDAIPAATKAAIRDGIRALRSQAVILNEGAANEERTERAVYHICRHDEGLPCDPEQEI